MQDPADWDVLVAHGLGIDHAGHTHDVDSAQMLGKLRETDDHVKQARGQKSYMRSHHLPGCTQPALTRTWSMQF